MLAEDSKFEGGSAQNAGMVVWSIFDGLGEPWARAHDEVLRGQNNSRVEEGRQYWKQEGLEVRAQKKQIEDNKNYWKNEALQSRKEKKKYLDNITYLRFF